MSTTSKTIDKSIVKHYAEALMNKNGSTTTLDVKNALRADGYFAEQAVVSGHMSTLNSEEGWDYTSNGSYNTYSIPDPIAAVTTSSSSNSSKSSATSKVDAVIEIIEDLFKIHRYAMSATSRIGLDLGLDSLQIEELALECERQFGADLSGLKVSTTTIGEIQKAIDGSNATPAVQKLGRVKIDIEPTRLFGHPTSHCGATDDEIKDLCGQNIIDDNDWILSLGNSQTRMIYSGDESRDHVRTAFARKMGAKIQDTRTRRVKTVL